MDWWDNKQKEIDKVLEILENKKTEALKKAEEDGNYIKERNSCEMSETVTTEKLMTSSDLSDSNTPESTKDIESNSAVEGMSVNCS